MYIRGFVPYCRHNDAGFALDRFDHESADVRILLERLLQRYWIVVRHLLEGGHVRTEIRVALRIRRG